MRIAHFVLGRVNPESPNGVDRAVYFLTQAQAALGHDVTIFSITDRPPISVPDVRVMAFPSKRSLGSRILPTRLWRLARGPWSLPNGLVEQLLQLRPGIVEFHSVHIPEAVWVSRRLRKAGIPYCVAPHGALSVRAQRYRRRVRKQLFGLIERPYLAQAAFLHAVSKAEERELRSQSLGRDVVVARNCIDLGIVPERPDGEPLLRQHPQLRGKRVIGYLGRLDPDQKGLDLLLRSWATIHPRPESVLLLVGSDWRGGLTRLRNLADALGLGDSVVFSPPVSADEKWGVFAVADIFVHPSRWEGAPFTILEALAAGTPVLVSPAADPDALIEVSRAGWVVPAEPEGLSRALRMTETASEDELRRMGGNARRLIEQEYRWHDTAATLVAAYGAVM